MFGMLWFTLLGELGELGVSGTQQFLDKCTVTFGIQFVFRLLLFVWVCTSSHPRNTIFPLSNEIFSRCLFLCYKWTQVYLSSMIKKIWKDPVQFAVHLPSLCHFTSKFRSSEVQTPSTGPSVWSLSNWVANAASHICQHPANSTRVHNNPDTKHIYISTHQRTVGVFVDIFVTFP